MLRLGRRVAFGIALFILASVMLASSAAHPVEQSQEGATTAAGSSSAVDVDDGRQLDDEDTANLTLTSNSSTTTGTSATTTTGTSTSTQVPTILTVNSSDNTGDSNAIVTIIIISCVAGLVLLLGTALGIIALCRRYKKANAIRTMKAKELDSRVEELEARRAATARDVDAYVVRREDHGSVSDSSLQHDTFIDTWRVFFDDSRSFLDNEYRPSFAARRPSLEGSAAIAVEAPVAASVTAEAAPPAATVGATTTADPEVVPGAAGGPAAKARSAPRKQSKPAREPRPKPQGPPPRPKGTPRPRQPTTKDIDAQLEKVKALSSRLDKLGSADLRTLQQQVKGGMAVVSPETRIPYSMQTPGSGRSWNGRHHSDGDVDGMSDYHNDLRHDDGHHTRASGRWDDQVEILPKLRHPLINRIELRNYGVLGVSQNDRDPTPGSAVDAVVVDPAGWAFIGSQNNPGYAGGASGSIYRWLRIERSGFPASVYGHFCTARNEDEAETMALFNAYGPGQHVIHAIGPRIDRLLEGVTDLAGVYVNIFAELCIALARKDIMVPRVLRMPPVSSGIFLRNRRLERHMPQMTAAGISLAFARLPLSMQELLRTVSIELCIFMPKEMPAYQEAFGYSGGASGAPLPLELGTGLGRVPAHSGDFSWIRSKNSPKDRLERLGAMLLTNSAIFSGGYQIPGTPKPNQLDLKALRGNTQVLRAPGRSPAVPPKQAKKTVIDWEEHLTVMEVAMKSCTDTAKVVAVNAASAYHVGGGILTGGRHALEETWCMVSTLLPSLLEVSWTDLLQERQRQATTLSVAETRHRDHMHIPVDGCVVTPGVDIFRDVSAKGYVFHEQSVKLAGVVSIAMFNMNSRVSDSPVDAPRDFAEYCRLSKHKFRSMIAGARQLNADILVCPDIGCGVFDNDPCILGTMLGEVLVEASGAFSQIILTGKAAFAQAARAVVAGETTHLKRPQFFTHGKAPLPEAAPLPPTTSSSRTVPTASGAAGGFATAANSVASNSSMQVQLAGSGTSRPTKVSSVFCCGRGSTDVASEPLQRQLGKAAVAKASTPASPPNAATQAPQEIGKPVAGGAVAAKAAAAVVQPPGGKRGT